MQQRLLPRPALCAVALLFLLVVGMLAWQQPRLEPWPLEAHMVPKDMCLAARAAQVCAHRPDGVTEDPLLPNAGRSGLLHNLRHLMRVGVRCLEVDLFITADKQFIVGHPGVLRSRLGLPSGSLTASEVLSIGHTAPPPSTYIDDGSPQAGGIFMPLTDLLEFVASHAATLSLVTLEMKDDAQRLSSMEHLIALLLQHPSSNALLRVVVVSVDLPDVARMLQMRGVQAAFIVRDRDGEQAAALALQRANHITYWMPSVLLSPEWFAAARSTARRLVVWTVDTDAQLLQALARGASYIVSNRPVAMQDSLRQLAAALARHCYR